MNPGSPAAAAAVVSSVHCLQLPDAVGGLREVSQAWINRVLLVMAWRQLGLH